MASRAGSPYNTNRYRLMKRAFIAAAEPYCTFEHCPVPGRWVNTSASGNTPYGPSIDHAHPTSKGGDMWDLANWRLVHRICNTRKGARLPGAGTAPINRNSRKW